MRRVTLLLSGVPQYVTLRDLSYNLDRLFNTDEIETFKIRDLPNHPQTNKRQIALDFRSGYDAMAAQEKLEGYTYELDNGREYTLHAKINKFAEYMCSESPEYRGSRWYGDDWTALGMIPNVSDGDMYRAHARLDAQLELLRKQKLVLEKQKELLYERQKLKRKYGSIISSSYEAASTPQAQYDQNIEGPVQQIHDSETEVSPPKRSRSTSQDCSSSKHPNRSRSIDRGHIVPQIGWYDARTKTRELPHSGEDSRSHRYSGDRRSSSREVIHRYPFARHREPRSKSNERKSPSKERGVRARSRSQEWRVHSRKSRLRERRSHSREIMSHSQERICSHRSRSQDRIPCRRSRSRERARESRSNWDHRDRRLRSPDRRNNQLAIMPRSPRGSPSEWSVDSSKADRPTDNKHKTDIKNKEVRIKVENGAKNSTNGDTKENKTDNTKQNKDYERKKVDKYNSKIRKAEKTASRIQALSKDIMTLFAIVVDEIMDRDKIRISASNKVALINILEELVQERLEPLARVKKNDDNEVLKKYKMQYPMEGDSKTIKEMLNEIPKLKEPEATVTVSSDSDTTDRNNAVDVEVLDVGSEPTEQQCNTNNITSLDVTPVESTDDAPKIKTETKDEPVLIIDIDSAEKQVPRHPQFFLVIKHLVKEMNKVIRSNKLGGEIKFAELKHVLRQILRNMLKGQGFLPREEIIRRFREVYPMENDVRFIRNTIKDIRDGKYPVLTGHIGDTPEYDCVDDDDVVLVEKKCDVVTVTDSDDDDVEKKPKIEGVNLDCEPTNNNLGQTKPISSPTRTMPGQSNDHVMSGPVDPDQGTSSKSGQDQPKSVNAAPANTDLDKPGQGLTGPTNTNGTTDNLGQANIDAANVNQTIIGRANTVQIVESANSGQAKIGAIPGRVMPDFGSPGQVKTGLANPIQEQTCLLNPGQADICFMQTLSKPSQAKTASAKTGPANPDQTKPGPANPGQVKTGPANPIQVNTGPANPVQVKTGPANPDQTKTGPANPGQVKTGPANPDQTKPAPANPGQVKTGPANPDQTKTGPANPGQVKTGPANPDQTKPAPANPGQVKTGPANPDQTKTGPANPGQVKTGPANLDQAKIGPANRGQVKTVPANPDQVKTAHANPDQVKTGPANAGQAKTGPANPGQVTTGAANPGQAKKGPVNISQAKSSPGNPGQAKTGLIPGHADVASNNTMSMEEKEKRASLDNTIQNLESLNNASIVDVVVSPPSVKVGRERKKSRRQRKRAGKEVQVTPENNKTNHSKDKVNRNTDNEENDNNLKVTAITIVTTLNELIAKSTSKEPEKDTSADEIKQEIKFEEDAELDESSLNLDNGPRVTSITIMTSDAELFSLGNEDRKEVTEIKNETDVYNDAEDKLVNDIEKTLDDVNFGNVQSESIVQNSVNTEQFRSVNSTETFSTVNTSQQISKTQCDSRTVQDDEESIESIVKYVASMY